MKEIRKGRNDLDKFATKIALALTNLCGNLILYKFANLV